MNFEYRNLRTGTFVTDTGTVPVTVPVSAGISGDQIVPYTYKQSPVVSVTLPPIPIEGPTISGTGNSGDAHTISGYSFVGSGTEEFQWVDKDGAVVATTQAYIPPLLYNGLLVAGVRKVGGSPSAWLYTSIDIITVSQGWIIEDSTVIQAPLKPPAYVINNTTVEA